MRRTEVAPPLSSFLLLLALTAILLLPDGALAQSEGAAATAMSPARQRAYAEMTEAFGFVPGFIKTMSDASVEDEWHTLRSVQMAPGAIPNKYRELIGLAVAAARGCEYCTYFHTQFAKLNGATDAEIEDAVHFAKSNVGWSTYLHGMRYPYDQFQKDVDQIVANARTKAAAAQKK
jgi:AhpD family alkylhydroperoxidase